MNAIDTNVLVRALTTDDPKQTALVRSLFASGPAIWIAKTVLLEAAWVLRSAYGLTDVAISAAFGKLQGLPNVQMEDEVAVLAALELTDSGLQFSDALHLCSRPAAATFLTFDKSFVSRAKRAGVAKIGAI